jgi:hypothetical protein
VRAESVMQRKTKRKKVLRSKNIEKARTQRERQKGEKVLQNI